MHLYAVEFINSPIQLQSTLYRRLFDVLVISHISFIADSCDIHFVKYKKIYALLQ